MGLFFSKKRKDGTLVEATDPLLSIMPYVMRTRTEAQVSYRFTVKLDVIDAFIREKRREGCRITFFHILISALLKVMAERPALNRFVAGRRLYQHNHFDLLYVVKEKFSDDAPESVARVRFDEDDTIFEVAEQMEIHTAKLQGRQQLKSDDKIIRQVLRLPRWLLRLAFAGFRWMDFHGIIPSSLIESLPFYSSLFVSHLGTIGGDSATHHLYEMGTCSIFIVIGKQDKKPEPLPDGSVNWIKTIDLTVTLDERICDGYYFVKSLKLLQRYLQDPWLLEYPGINIPIFRTEQCSKFRREQREKLQKKQTENREKQKMLIREAIDEALDERGLVLSEVPKDFGERLEAAESAMKSPVDPQLLSSWKDLKRLRILAEYESGDADESKDSRDLEKMSFDDDDEIELARLSKRGTIDSSSSSSSSSSSQSEKLDAEQAKKD